MRLFHRTAGTTLTRLAFVLPLAILALAVSPAGSRATPAPAAHFAVRTLAAPTNIAPGGHGQIADYVTNNGGVPTNGEPITISDSLPAGVTAGEAWLESQPTHDNILQPCEITAVAVTCTTSEALAGSDHASLLVVISVTVGPGAEATHMNSVRVAGGGIAPQTAGGPITVSASLPGAALSDFNFGLFGADGGQSLQAGSHPALLTAGFDPTSHLDPSQGESATHTLPVEALKTVSVDLPLGLVGNVQAAAKCPQYEIAQNEGGANCPAASVVGTVSLSTGETGYFLSAPAEGASAVVSSLYNVVPEHGYPAEFGFDYLGQAAFLYASLAHTSAGYVLRTTDPAISRVLTIKGTELSFFGDPSAQNDTATARAPIFTTGSQCGVQTSARLKATTWVDPSHPEERSVTMPALTGCSALHFDPTLGVSSESSATDSPTGLGVRLHFPQNTDPEGLASATMKSATVTLPAGMALSPAAANGLSGCPRSGPNGIDLYEEGPVNADEPEGTQHLLRGNCPRSSQIGTARIDTPVLAVPLSGRVYLAEPDCRPCGEADAEAGRMVKLYIEVEGEGIVLKLPGTVEIGGAGSHSVETGLSPGQLRTVFSEDPEQPVSDIRIDIDGGPLAPLATPQSCGEQQIQSTLEPWSFPDTPDATPSAVFAVDSTPSGAPCAAARAFDPGVVGGTVSSRAAGYSPFVFSLTRADGEQDVGRLSTTLPAGLLARLPDVSLCAEPAAAAGSCGPASQIGTVRVLSGSGSQPLPLTGQIYMTRGYAGAPFGLSVVVPAKAGPFDLGDVVVKATVAVDPTTAAITITSDPLPQMHDGVPLRLRAIEITVDRPGFTFNPTNCNPLAVTGTVASAEGAAAAIGSRFQASGCASLPFKPGFSASTSGRTSRAAGASLHVRLVPPAQGPLTAADGSATGHPTGGEANIARVKVDLPKALPSRLSTLQKACTAGQFAANPAGCPAAADVGSAVVRTPLLAVPLTGPAYLVSHGGEAFPDLVLVLQGEGVMVELVGNTQIKGGVTSSTFASVPDVPVGSFELTLPQGKFSALAPNGELCAQTLAMPTEFVAQNGAVIHQSTPVAVEGCPNRVAFVAHAVSGRTLTISVSVPGKGRLQLSGRGLTTASKDSKGRETLALKLRATRSGKLATKVSALFAPTPSGAVRASRKLSRSLAVRFGK